MEVKLIVVGGKNAGRAVPVAGGKFFIGRAPDCHLRPVSELISQHHCLIVVEGGTVSVRDFGSKTGTWVNGERVVRQRQLKTGDRLRIGQLEFEVRFVPDGSGQQKQQIATAPNRPLADDDLDVSEWFGGAAAAAVDEPACPVEAVEPTAEESEEEPLRETSEEERERKRRQQQIVGVSKAAQARRITETTRDAAAEALRKFFTGGR